MAEKPENPRKFKWVQEVSPDGSIKYKPNYEVYTFKPPPSEIIEAKVRSSLDSSTATSASYALNATSASFASTALTASFLTGTVTSASFATTALTASFLTGTVTSASYALNATSASYAVSASHEIIKEISSSYADTASFAQSGNGVFSGSFSGSYEGDGSEITGVISSSYAITASHALNAGGGGSTFPFSGSAVITGSLIVTGSATGGGDIDTTAAALYDDSGNISIAYGTRALNATSGPKSIDYENRFLFDSANVQSVDYGSRLLKDRTGATVSNFEVLGSTFFSGSLHGTSSWAENVTSASFASTASFLTGTVTSASYAISASHLIGGGGGSDPAININANGITLTEVTSDSDLPTTLAANTTYLIRGNVYTGKTLNVTNAGSSANRNRKKSITFIIYRK